MDTKSLRGVEIKDASKGLVSAVFASYNVIDKDGDVTLPGAFDDGVPVAISAYGHKSWEGALPVGAGTLRTTADEAILEGQFFLDTPDGLATFTTLKRMVEAGLTPEWSYGYDVLDSELGTFQGRKVRFLKKQLVHEVSPVLVGAGEGTRVLSMKSAGVGTASGFKRTIGVHETATVARAWDGAKMLAALPEDATPKQLRSVFAHVAAGSDPEAKSSYRFPHHHGPDGPANVRACVMGIALLNGAKGDVGLSEEDRKAAYEHLAAHLRDADRDVPELRPVGAGAMKFADEGAAVLTAVSSFVDRATEVMALRAAKGKGLSPQSADLLTWIDDELGRLKSLLSNPHIAADEPLCDDEVRTVLEAIRRLHDV